MRRLAAAVAKKNRRLPGMLAWVSKGSTGRKRPSSIPLTRIACAGS
ncbi:MAG: hypothetical protein AB7V45_12785 [Candidatus Krumholzibacteriia bacterium]